MARVRSSVTAGVLPLLLLLLLPSRSSAQQSFEVAGARALGMGGAFVAVADDASAVHWNPAGLVFGDPFGVTIGWDKFQFRNPSEPPRAGAGQESAGLASFGTWPVGLSYGHFEWARLARQSDTSLRAEGLVTHQFGVTVLQTVFEGLVVGTTLKYLLGTATAGPAGGASSGDALDAVLAQDGDSDAAFDLDLGVMADLGRVRAGLTVKNLLEPKFTGPAGIAAQLQRRARLGLAVFPVDGLTLALDVDLDTADPLVGLRRMIALGGETRLGSRVALRGGVRWLRDSGTRPIGTLGGSVRLRQGLWLDGYVARSRAEEDRGFGIALRAGY